MRLRNLGFALALTLSWSTMGCSTESEPEGEEAAEEGTEEGEADEADEAEEEEEEEAEAGEETDADKICCEIEGKFRGSTRGECTEHKGAVAEDAKCAAKRPAPKGGGRKVTKPKKK